MGNQSGEIDRAVSALAAELIKLTALEGETRDALCVTIENALSRLVLAIAAQNNEPPASALPMPPAEHVPPVLTGPI